MAFVRMSSARHIVVGAAWLSVPALCAAQTAQSSGQPPAHNAAADLAEQIDESNTIVVNGSVSYQGQRGAVQTDIVPEQQLGPADIRAYGVNSVTDLLAELAPLTRSDRGRGEGAVTLLNGRRISGFAEIRDIPTEAIERVDILPEEAALKLGYGASQRVVNIVLRRRFRSITGELEGTVATRGHGYAEQAEAGLLRIRGGDRFNLNIEANASDAITEADRDLTSRSGGRNFDFAGNIVGTGGAQIDPALSGLAGLPVTIAGVPASAANGRPALADFVATANRANISDTTPYTTIRPSTKTLALNSVYATTIFGNVGASLNATLDVSDSDAMRGLAGVNLVVPAGSPYSPFAGPVSVLRYPGKVPLKQNVDGIAGHLGVTLNKDMGKWRHSLTGGYDHSETRTATERSIDASALQAAITAGTINPFATLPPTLLRTRTVDRAKSINDSGNLQFVSAGPVANLPAGALTASIKTGITASNLDATSVRSGVTQNSSLARTDLNGQLSIDLPLTSTRNDILAALGNLSANFNVAGDRISNFGTLAGYGYGANWTPRKGVSLIASFTEDRNAPSAAQLSNPTVLTPAIQAYDYTRGTSVLINQISGGNPALDADRRHVMKLGATLKPFEQTDITFTANYITSRIRDAIASFPEPTAAIEAAFPTRFTRDTGGNLTSIDARPINFERHDTSELRWGFTFTRSLKSDNSKLIAAIRETPRFKEFQAQREREQAARAALQAQGGGQQAGQPAGQGGGRDRGGQNGGQGGQDGQRGPGAGGFGGPGGPGGGRGPGGPGGFGGRAGGGQNGGRIQVAFFHTWHLKDEVLIRRGLPVLDLLKGDTIGSSGGTSEHELELQLGYMNNGIGARLTGNWQSATDVNAGPLSPTGNLRFADRTTANLRLFVNLGQQASLVKYWWAQGGRISLAVNNLFDSKQRVTDATGATPLRYQAGYLDPTGRTIRISYRKLFF